MVQRLRAFDLAHYLEADFVDTADDQMQHIDYFAAECRVLHGQNNHHALQKYKNQM